MPHLSASLLTYGVPSNSYASGLKGRRMIASDAVKLTKMTVIVEYPLQEVCQTKFRNRMTDFMVTYASNK